MRILTLFPVAHDFGTLAFSFYLPSPRISEFIFDSRDSDAWPAVPNTYVMNALANNDVNKP